jgi:hypothetical protein
MTRYYNIDFLILPHAAAKVEDFLNFTRTIIDTANYTTDGPQQRYSFLFSEKAGKNRDAVCTPLSKLSAATTEGVTVITHTYRVRGIWYCTVFRAFNFIFQNSKFLRGLPSSLRVHLESLHTSSDGINR